MQVVYTAQGLRYVLELHRSSVWLQSGIYTTALRRAVFRVPP